MRFFYLLFCCFSLPALGQEMPSVFFNHVFMRMDSTDIKAMQRVFQETNFATFITRTTYRKTDSYTNSYLYGTDNYVEIKGTDDYPESLGSSGLAFCIENSGGIYTADSLLKATYETVLKINEKKINDTAYVPWYTVVYINDTTFFSQSNIFLWLMEYRKEYFDYYHFPYEQQHITATAFLNQYGSLRTNKILKRFTSMTLKATPAEKEFYASLFLKFDYKQIQPNTFVDQNNFIIYLKDRLTTDIYSIGNMEFEATTHEQKNFIITESIKISMNKGKGKIIFNKE